MKDLGPSRYCLGIEVVSSPKGYFLSHAKYANEVIHRASLTNTKISNTSVELNVKRNTTDGVLLDNPTLYQELVGCLVYLTVTRLDLAYVVHVKQTVVARSTAKVEYHAMAHATAEVVWLHCLLSDLGIPQSSPTSLYCDNHSAIQIAHNTVFYEQTKHIEIDCHFVRQHLQSGSISLPFRLFGSATC
ncbi:uncharacterized protein LOC114274674 [Camellia sinensis]|uniref:uncharacterized protein LOC114274674 n=1 Tax=Camellia sinensis TaxID=4442 RepID=UPI0010356D72|nr:uncharacterized protein LOC114274674 [Camellia sinensis]